MPIDHNAEYINSLWQQYQKKPTKELQTILAKQYTPLVYKIATNFNAKSGKGILDYDDLLQAGMLGLLDAIEKYNPNNKHKAQFQTYASFRIRGAILEQFRIFNHLP